MEYARIAIDNPVTTTDRLFTYGCPDGMVSIGDEVMIPFGNGNRQIKGWVFDVQKTPECDVTKLKHINNRAGPVLTPENVELCKFLHDTYLCRYYDGILCFLFSGKALSEALLWVQDQQAARDYIESNRRGKKQNALLELLLEKGSLTKSVLKNQYGFDYSIMKVLEEKGLVVAGSRQRRRDPLRDFEDDHTKITQLTQEQRRCLDIIKASIHQGAYEGFLLHGVTGSGKTEIYMQSIAECLRQGRTAIMLVPEISLTMQTIERFKGRFGSDAVAVIHSKLSPGERFDEYSRIKDGEAKIVIGARSALFAPVENIGAIIVDEEHESSYKSDYSPKYETAVVAEQRARLNHGILILGTATPSVNTFYRAERGELVKLELKERYNANLLPQVETVDMREELQAGNRSIFSTTLFQHMQRCLVEGQQIILFLNRRGYSTFVSCRSCGFVMKCPQCGVSMTYHKREHEVVCHICEHKEPLPAVCPECGSKYIKDFGTGTEKIEETCKLLFPQAAVARLDLDTVRTKGSGEAILKAFREGRTKILVGTQLVAKGLDFKSVGLVGIVAADISLNIPDYRSSERTFQLVTQAAGRAGRGEERGNVVVQTYSPEHYAIQAACNQDYEAFYREEIQIRELMSYPPFADIVQLLFTSPSEEKAEIGAQYFCDAYRELAGPELGSRLLGPAKAHIEKNRGRYRFQALIKCKDQEKEHCLSLIGRLKMEMAGGPYRDCFVAVDINPYSMA